MTCCAVWSGSVGYFLVLRESTFTLGDRISMGGVRGDLGFIQTIMQWDSSRACRGRSHHVGKKPPVHRRHRDREQF